MSFQGYIDNIKKKTGKSPEDFINLAEQKGFLEDGTLKPTIKAGQIVEWLKTGFQLGHGHAMAIYVVLKQGKETFVVNGETKYSDKKAVKKPIATTKTKN